MGPDEVVIQKWGNGRGVDMNGTIHAECADGHWRPVEVPRGGELHVRIKGDTAFIEDGALHVIAEVRGVFSGHLVIGNTARAGTSRGATTRRTRDASARRSRSASRSSRGREECAEAVAALNRLESAQPETVLLRATFEGLPTIHVPDPVPYPPAPPTERSARRARIDDLMLAIADHARAAHFEARKVPAAARAASWLRERGPAFFAAAAVGAALARAAALLTG